MKRVKYIIAIFLTIIFFYSCVPDISKPNKYIKVSKVDVIKNIGKPKACGEILFHRNVNLFEYQNNLYNIFQNLGKQDTIVIEECRWKIGNRNLVIWWGSKVDNSELSIDCLEWTDDIEW